MSEYLELEATDGSDILDADERYAMSDVCKFDYIPSTPSFWDKVFNLKPSSLQLQCYFYIAGRTSLRSARSVAIDYHSMANTLHTKYNSIMPCIKYLIRERFIVKFDKRFGTRFYIPDFEKIRLMNEERKHRSQAERLTNWINEEIQKKSENFGQVSNHDQTHPTHPQLETGGKETIK